MKVIPYVKLRGRTLLRSAYAKGELSKLASDLSDKYEMIYIADSDGLDKNKPQLDIVQEICDELPTMYEGGLRFGANVIDLLITGAERAVIGTATLVSLEDLRTAFKLSENITFKVDFRDGIVSFDPEIAGRAFLDLAKDVHDIGISEIVVPRELAKESLIAKRDFGLKVGVLSPMAERSSMETLGVDYIVSPDYGRSDGNE